MSSFYNITWFQIVNTHENLIYEPIDHTKYFSFQD